MISKIFAAEPLVSILIICYNQKKFLSEAIHGALNQNYSNIEIIISDDCSTDGTQFLLKDFQEKYPELITIKVNSDNLGITGNCNKGLAACNGKYIAIQGGDDIFLPGKITAQVKWLESEVDNVLCYHDMDVFDDNTGKSIWLWNDRFIRHEGGASELIKYGMFMCASSVMFKRSSCSQVIFNSRIPISSDWLFFVDCLAKSNGKIGCIPSVYGRYRRHSNNITTNSLHEMEEGLIGLNIVEELYSDYCNEIAYQKSLIYMRESKREFLHGHMHMVAYYHMKSIFMSFEGYLSAYIMQIKRAFNIKI
jgi:glycosyltransferase involved in cell wall biosynthesis